MKSLIFLTIITIISISLPSNATIICEENKSITFSSTTCIEKSVTKSNKSTTKSFSAYYGHITEDMTWDNDYIINGDVIIDDGATLTIEAGVTLLFFKADSNQDQVGDIDFIVHGQLQCKGTKEKPVVFKSYGENPQASDWGGIDYFNTDSDENSIMENTFVLHAYEGVHVNGINLNYTSGKVQFSGKYGIRISQNAHANFTDIDISDGLGSGIGGETEEEVTALEGFILTPVAVFDNCSIVRNLENGVYIYNVSPEVKNCLIAFNLWSGVNTTGDVSNSLFNKCNIQRNGRSGFFFENQSKGNVYDSTILENEGLGVKLVDNSTPVFNKNNIHNNIAFDDNNTIFEQTFSTYDWYISGYGSVSHPKTSFSPRKIINLTYKKDGDYYDAEHCENFYRNYTQIWVDGNSFIDNHYTKLFYNYEVSGHNMSQQQCSGYINKKVYKNSDIILSIYT